MNLTKTCKTCQVEKATSEFTRISAKGYLSPYCRPCAALRLRTYRASEAGKASRRREYYARRAEVLRLLGGQCVVCGLDDVEVLEVDHVLDDGAEHRRQAGGHGPAIQQMLMALRKGTAEGRWQILCANCHARKTFRGRLES